VRDIAVIGVPDPDMGEAVLGVVQLESQHVACDRMADELIAYCRERLSLHKCPRRIDFVADLPRNDVGKLVKRALKQRYWEGHGRLI
jgi:acyl-coenzyme A synthetase/AMP-(fatty) acid ligase